MLPICKDRVCLGPDQCDGGSTFLVRKRSDLYPRPAVDGARRKVVSGAGGVLLPGPRRRSGWMPLCACTNNRIYVNQASFPA